MGVLQSEELAQESRRPHLGLCVDWAPALGHQALPGDIDAQHVERVEDRLLAPHERRPRLDLVSGAGEDVVSVAVPSINGGLQLRQPGGHLRTGFRSKAPEYG